MFHFNTHLYFFNDTSRLSRCLSFVVRIMSFTCTPVPTRALLWLTCCSTWFPRAIFTLPLATRPPQRSPGRNSRYDFFYSYGIASFSRWYSTLKSLSFSCQKALPPFRPAHQQRQRKLTNVTSQMPWLTLKESYRMRYKILVRLREIVYAAGISLTTKSVALS